MNFLNFPEENKPSELLSILALKVKGQNMQIFIWLAKPIGMYWYYHVNCIKSGPVVFKL